MVSSVADQIEKLDELETKLKEYISEQRERFDLERKFLQLVLEKQGFTSSIRRSENLDMLKSFASVNSLMSEVLVGSDQEAREQELQENLDALLDKEG